MAGPADSGAGTIGMEATSSVSFNPPKLGGDGP